MTKQTLILDLDDTLIHCNKYFVDSKNHFANQMQVWFKSLKKEEILQKQLEIDLKNVEEHGLHSLIYTDSLVTTYLYFCKKFKRKIKGNEIKRICKLGQSVFQIEVQPLPHMYEVLNKLQEDGHHLCLFTGGDHQNQSRKIKQLGLETFFEDRIFIFEHKNTLALQTVLKQIKSVKKTTWMIGNSLRTDIKPAIELGINAIHIPSELEWSYNIVDLEIEPNGTYTELKSLLDLPKYIREHTFYNEAIS